MDARVVFAVAVCAAAYGSELFGVVFGGVVCVKWQQTDLQCLVYCSYSVQVCVSLNILKLIDRLLELYDRSGT